MAYLFGIAIALAFTFTTLPSSEGTCDGFAFGHCTTKLQRGDNNMDGIFYSVESLDGACKAYEEATECMQDVLPDCTEELQETWAIEVQAYDFLCGSARLEYERYVGCFNRSDPWLVSDLTWCHRTKEDIRDVMLRSSRRWLPHHVHWIVCKMLREYERCISHSIVKRCGLDEATWQREVLHQLLMPALHQEKC